MKHLSVDVVVLTYNRPNEIRRNVEELSQNLDSDINIIVVDNNSEADVELIIKSCGARADYIRLKENIGVGARNIGVERSKADVVITLDDDVYGLTQDYVEYIRSKFLENNELTAVNFRVIDDVTENQVNWIHHRKMDDWKDREFETYEISEGAVALRRLDFLSVGGYPDNFFISHEGPYLALSLLKASKRVLYSPDVTVRHSHAEAGRVSWRRYYYDTRNVIWMSITHLPIIMALKKCTIELGALLLYALRDGYLKYWLKGLIDGIKGARWALRERDPLSGESLQKYRAIASNNPGVFYMLKIRIFRKTQGVGI
jgi:GT2 family glycosyltransferase